jgi:predicted amidohydrolase YtcJ
MHKITMLIPLFCLFIAVSTDAQLAQVQNDRCPSSDLLIHNTTIYTANDNHWQAEALAIKDGRFVFIGTDKEAENWFCGAAKAINLSGNYVYPGFTDSHQHLEGVGRRTRTLSLFGLPTLQTTVEKIEQWANRTKDGDWVLGRGWIEREWTDEKRFLRAADVDTFTKNKPLFMPRADGVSALVNSKALDLAGISKNTPDPEGGKYERYADGTPTGYILATAMQTFRDIIPPETDQYIKENLRLGMIANSQMGWTYTHDAGMTLRELRLLEELHKEEKMLQKVYVAVPIKEAKHLIQNMPYTTDDGLIKVNGVKVFIDGTLGSRGAALKQPYSDAPHNGFMNRTTKAELMPILSQSLQTGWQVMTHVIGDRALSVTLDWYNEAWNNLPKDQWNKIELRWRLEHAQLIPPTEQNRLVDMKVIPSMQPSHAIGDLNFAASRLGVERLAHAYPWQMLLDKGLKIVAGSDAPVEVGDPRIEFYAAISRTRLDGSSEKDWHPELAVSRENALRMLTIWPAYAAFTETEQGSITLGKRADLSIFDTDFMTAKKQNILKAKTKATIVNGVINYSNLED